MMLVMTKKIFSARFLFIELSFVVFLKLLLLTLLWWVCFSHPSISEKDTTVLEQHILSRG